MSEFPGHDPGGNLPWGAKGDPNAPWNDDGPMQTCPTCDGVGTDPDTDDECQMCEGYGEIPLTREEINERMAEEKFDRMRDEGRI